MDGDDWVGEGFYASLFSAMTQTDSDIVAAGFSRELFEKTARITNALPSGVYEGDNLEKLYGSMISCGDFFIRRDSRARKARTSDIGERDNSVGASVPFAWGFLRKVYTL